MLSLFSIISESAQAKNFIPVVFELSQSNGGNAEEGRIALTDQIEAAGINKMAYTVNPIDCEIWDKSTMDLNDNGVMEPILAGSNTAQFSGVFGAEISLAPLLKRHTSSKCFYIKAMRGGTNLTQVSGDDWNANSTNELLDMALNYFATPAIRHIKSTYPNKEIRVVLLRHQGESDANTTGVSNYYNDSINFLNKIRSFEIDGVKHFETSPFVDVLLHFNLTTAEGDINDIKRQLAANLSNFHLIDISDQPRKIDLTSEQKGGITPNTPDNAHTSYLGQLAKGERTYDLLRSLKWL